MCARRPGACSAFGPNDENPLLRGLPDLLQVPPALLQWGGTALARVPQSLVVEASAQRCGHLAVVQRLVGVGVLAGLADLRLARVLNALHAEPGPAGWHVACDSPPSLARRQGHSASTSVLGALV